MRAHDDLLPLFLGEARDRLERLTLLAPLAESDREVAHEARRELHALKGASNMMSLEEMSGLCHRAEGLLNPPQPGGGSELVALLDRVVAVLDSLQAQVDRDVEATPAPFAGEGDHNAVGALPPAPLSRRNKEEVRIGTSSLDRLADHSARLRMMAVAANGMVERAFHLTRLAEKGVEEKHPRQVLSTLATSLRRLAIELETGQREFHGLAERQLDSLLGIQLQSLRPFLLTLARHARDLARSLGKHIEVEVAAGDTQLDRRIVAALKEALVHLVRNAVDHGLESPERRGELGKPASATLRLAAMTDGGRVHITVEDDGGGIDVEEITLVALRQELVADAEVSRLSSEEALQLVFLPGFTTRPEASDVSGRGVGLDGVAAAIRAVGGDVWVDSEPGRGTKFTVQVPVDRRGEKVLVLEAGDSWVALPAAVVRGFRPVAPGSVVRDGPHTLVRVNGRFVPALVLSGPAGNGKDARRVIIDGQAGATAVVLVVERVVGEEEVLIRPLPSAAGPLPLFDGMAILGSGRPVPVISPHRLGSLEVTTSIEQAEIRRARRPLRLLLVDDSVVTREMLRRMLEDAGFSVLATGLAEEALTLLGEQEFDCLVTDIEMPGIDGLQLTRRLRDTPRHAHLPVVVVSTRDRPQDRRAGLEAGADAYVAKQGLDAHELVSLIRRIGGGS